MAIIPIRAVVFDMGGTLEDLYYDDAVRREATRGLQELLRGLGLDPGLSLPELQATVQVGIEAYQAWREETERELPPEALWAEYLLPDHGLCRERLEAAAEDLTLFYESNYYVRSLRPEAHGVLDALSRQGFRLGIISNVMSRGLVRRKLAEYGIAGYFAPVVTSSGCGWRKPNVRLFEGAARLLGLPAAACAYVGDTISRDVIGARRAGYGLAVQIKSFLTDKADRSLGAGSPLDGGLAPDAVVHDLRQVIGVVGAGMEGPGDH